MPAVGKQRLKGGRREQKGQGEKDPHKGGERRVARK